MSDQQDLRKRTQTPDDFYMPAMPPLWLLNWLERRWARWQRRCRIKRLLKMNRHLLADLGHSRAGLRQTLAGAEPRAAVKPGRKDSG